ncbi:MAG: type II secretion system protein [Sedimentisphaerales bacterium]|nr:type II secretion system protein [Sedimentisphaerales bacterium]
MGSNETRGEDRSVREPAPQRGVGSIIHHSLSTVGSRGSTLVELLVVIAVISLLMAILVPAVGRARRQARALVCRSTLRQWGQILAAYTTENNGRLACDQWGTMTALWLFRGTMPVGNADLTQRPLSLSVDTEPIRCCPTANEPPPETSGVYEAWHGENDMKILDLRFRHTDETFGGWEIFYPSPSFHGSYGFNERLLTGEFVPFRPHAWRRESFRVIDISGRENIPVLLDCACPVVCAEPNDPPQQEIGSSLFGMWSVCLNRHNACVNALFLDWSARRVGLKELWTLQWGPNFETRGPWTRAGGVQPEDWPRWMRNFKDF